MYCNRCGTQINENDKYCNKCGNFLQNNYVGNNKNRKNHKLSKASVIIGVISFLFIFISKTMVILLSIIGLVIGLIAFKKTKAKLGICLNLISLLVPIILFILFSLNPVNDIAGTWNCKYFNNGNFEELDYVITLKINRNSSFSWYMYGYEATDYLKGKITVKKLNKKVNGAQYYSLRLDGNKYVSNGILQNDSKQTEYEMALNTLSNNDALLMNAYSYNMYACFKDKEY